MNKPLLLLFIPLIVLASFTNAQTLSGSPTLTFTNTTGFGDNIATDGEGGSTAISDINIQVLPINNTGTKISADPLELHGADWGTPSILTYGGASAFYGWSIRSDNGADFSLVSFDFNDWGEWTGVSFTVQAFRNGSSLGTVSFNGNTGNSYIHLANPGVLTSIFQTVDEVRIYKQGGAGSWTGINNIKVSSPATILPVAWLSFSAIAKDNGVLLSWSTSTEQNTKEFEVQYGEGAQWNTLAFINAAGNSNTVRNYSYLHTSVAKSKQYYRILQRDINGKESYSSIAAIDLANKQNSLLVFPNPVMDRRITVNLEKSSTLQLYNAAGKLVIEKLLQQGTQQVELPLLPKGFYVIKAGERTQRILVQ